MLPVLVSEKASLLGSQILSCCVLTQPFLCASSAQDTPLGVLIISSYKDTGQIGVGPS